MAGMFCSKKGQFYILIALLLISYAFGLTRQDVPIRKSKDAFQLLHEGYVTEGSAIINNAVYEDANVTARFSAFTNDYVAFARSAEPGFRLVYLLKYKGQLTVGNRLDDALNVSVGSTSYLVGSGSETAVPVAAASFKISGISYDFSFSDEEIQLKAVFRSSDKLTIRVFVKK
ncbi:hypothetical protein HYV83_02540 [Candidatus Woesearchaeota archaeon]|nr:hypothetical protein [Candidatus Woesearchaeota archaeon]